MLRHTFCTNVQQAGLDVKSLQYLMGHSNASVTLDVYTHSSFESVERAFEQIAGNL
ncbi:MAG: tyrosine-type recombinase/integrase [Faecalibacterium sp.]|nr:tyrosine-type recombinase/integrase [Faecalibacterium sp.]MDY5504596.1 tyrosine-type recombinase/integrase [Faecalibacterium sp.]